MPASKRTTRASVKADGAPERSRAERRKAAGGEAAAVQGWARLQLSHRRHLRSGVEDRGNEERGLRARLDGTPRVTAAMSHLKERELAARLERRRAAHKAVPVQVCEHRILACGACTTAAKQLVGRPLHRQGRRLAKHELEQTVLDQAESLLGREPELPLLVDSKHMHVAALLPLHEGQLLV